MGKSDDIWKASNVGVAYIANIGLPIFLVIVSLFSLFWFVRETKRKRLSFRSMAMWFTLNIVYTTVIIYVLIVTALQIAGYDRAINIVDWIAHYVFGFSLDGGKEWVFILIFAFISYILIKTLRNSLKLADIRAKMDALNRRVSVLTGKVNKSTDYTQVIKIAPIKKVANKATHKKVASKKKSPMKKNVAKAKVTKKK